MLILILPSFFNFSFFSFFLSYIIHMDIFSVKDYSKTTGVRTLKFDTKLDSDELYCVRKEQPHIAYQSFYLFIFSFSPMEIFVTDFSAPIGAIVFKFCVHLQEGKVYCVNGN